MSVKQYGIFLSYAPTVDLRHEGLGRYLASFLKGAVGRSDVFFVLVCPSWSRDTLHELFESEGVPHERFRIVSPDGKPILLRLYEAYIARKKRARKPSWREKGIDALRTAKNKLQHRLEERLVSAHSFSGLLPLLFETAVLAAILLVVFLLSLLPLMLLGGVYTLAKLCSRLGHTLRRSLRKLRGRLSSLLATPKNDGFVLRLFSGMERNESIRLLERINSLTEVRAWYCPTAFWPAFNRIAAPRLMCVPDVVLTDFPVGFCEVGGDRFLSTFEAVQASIRSAEHFVTYSDAIKWNTLVDRYGIAAKKVAVIHHAPNDLSRWVAVSGFSDSEATSNHYCRFLLSQAFKKSSNPAYTNNFLNGAVDFIFYASQFRPNKNILALLHAYEYLLRKSLIKQKLIMTGSPDVYPVIKQFINKHNLENEVLCLHGLSVQQLAACYKLANLAVNPSLSEGGCPFTFTEALSVDTPVVMARIPVTEEVLTDPHLQEMTLFDPYDWKDMANKIEWALTNREKLLEVQRKSYLVLSQRTWTDVANEHIEVLERIAEQKDHAIELECV